MSLAFYRKYRPKTLEEMCGQETTVSLLKNAAASNRFAHAYLFYGGRGSGKTTTARLIAKLVNCHTRAKDQTFMKKALPCNTCISCQEIDAGNSLDVIEIDAASNRGIDEIRALQETMYTAPSKSSHKVFIIDEAHMLTTAAFNALLKTLEEPPQHGVIIMATTEYEKIPLTILSRTQRFLFTKLPKKIIAAQITKIAKTEQISIDADAIEIIAKASDGSMRDALSLLDQVKSVTSNTTIDAKIISGIIGKTSTATTASLATALLAKDTKTAMAIIKTLSDEGSSISQCTKDTLSYLQSVAAIQLNPELGQEVANEFTDSEYENLQEIAKKYPSDTVIAVLKKLLNTHIQLRGIPFPMIPMEIVIAELAKN